MESGYRPSPHESLTGTAGRLNQYGLVAYIDGKLGDFLLKLRQEVVPGCQLRSHVSILPPRPLTGSEAESTEFLQASSRHLAAFEVSLSDVEVFPVTNVIYVAIAAGLPELHAMHDKLNKRGLRYIEPFPYHPHITLAQELSEADHPGARQLCEARWKEYVGSRNFPVEILTFVRNTANCGWLDVSSARLEMAGSRL
ncbi:MAG: 2'-5' RNA ligase family protein [Bryobacteraceae bacterium]